MIINEEELWTPLSVEGPYREIWIDWRAGQSPTVRNLTRASAGFSTWEQGNPGYMYKSGDETLESNLTERDLGFWVDGKLNMSQQRPLAIKMANGVLGCIKHSTASQSREATVPLCSALVQPHRQYGVLFWAPQCKEDIKVKECAQRRATKMVKDLKGKT